MTKICEFCDAVYPDYKKKCTICKGDLENLNNKIKEYVKECVENI